ncbi:carbohydrate kinase family protein [Nocardioides sp. KR10-350]|uniref:carbohydrate kinase family protein n=1 Tax=Nocardioides cheoyonin TaxID=3156615 RepID=UPI0032B597DC
MSNLRRPKVISLGVHIVDVLGWPVTELPAGQGRIVLDDIAMTAAGTAAGTSVDLAELGVDVEAIGVVGDDLLGRFLRTTLEQRGVNCSALRIRPGAHTAATILPIRPNGDRPAMHFPGANPLMTLDDVDLDRVAQADALHVGGPDALGGFLDDGVGEVLKVARQYGLLTTMDVLSPCSPRIWERLAPSMADVHCFLPNEEQLQNLTGEDNLDRAAATVLEAGAGAVVVTTGACGASLYSTDGRRDFPSIPVDVIDTTGCGDAVSAGVLTGLLEERSIEEAVQLGMACAALVAERLGSDPAIQGRSQLDEFVASHV